MGHVACRFEGYWRKPVPLSYSSRCPLQLGSRGIIDSRVHCLEHDVVYSHADLLIGLANNGGLLCRWPIAYSLV